MEILRVEGTKTRPICKDRKTLAETTRKRHNQQSAVLQSNIVCSRERAQVEGTCQGNTAPGIRYSMLIYYPLKKSENKQSADHVAYLQ